MAAADPVPEISLVVPFFDEEESAGALVAEIGEAMTALGKPWEAILVNDGSGDRTGSELERAREAWPQCRIITLDANGGQGPALHRGLRETRGNLVATLDGDGQNPPSEIAALLPVLDGADLVVGVRTDRRDSLLRRGLSRLANAVRRRMLGDGLSDAGCALKVFRKEVVASFRPVPMLNCFMPAYALASGFRVTERPVRHRPRTAGRAKYGLRVMLWRPLVELVAVWWALRRSRRKEGGPRC
jgi:glycosyltransferase involved in cell wall biosynthesis